MIAPRRWWPVAAVALGLFAAALHVFHLTIEFREIWPGIENVLGVTTLVCLIAAVGFSTLWTLGNMIDRKIVSVEKAYELGYDACQADLAHGSGRRTKPAMLRLLHDEGDP